MVIQGDVVGQIDCRCGHVGQMSCGCGHAGQMSCGCCKTDKS